MNTRARVRRGLVALAGVAAVVVPAATADAAGANVGRFTTLAGGVERGLEIEGVAVLARTAAGTTGVVVLRGLQPGVTYAAHLHNQPCNFAGNPGGGHYMDVVGGGATPPNELWFSSTADPTGGITANRAGVAVGRGSATWVARPEAQSVIVHAIPTGGTTAGGPKIACADLV